MDFPLIKKLGLTVWDNANPHTLVVDADELESLLQSAQVVYGSGFKSTDEVEWSSHQLKTDTVSGLIIGITPIKKKTKTEAALEFMQMFVEQKTTWHSQQAWEEAKRILEMKDEV